jgi:DNA-directed RNA polymerase specialized sigma24 family protein
VTVVSQTADRTDAQLVELARAGDIEAWGALVDRYSPYVHAIAVRAFGLQDCDADEISQDVFGRLYADLGAIRGELSGPVATATRTLCLERRGDATLEPASAVVLLRIEAAMDVHGAVGLLDDPGRELLYRFFVSNESYRTIAEELDLPVTALPRQIASALDDFCDLLARESDCRPGSAESRL